MPDVPRSGTFYLWVVSLSLKQWLAGWGFNSDIAAGISKWFLSPLHTPILQPPVLHPLCPENREVFTCAEGVFSWQLRGWDSISLWAVLGFFLCFNAFPLTPVTQSRVWSKVMKSNQAETPRVLPAKAGSWVPSLHPSPVLCHLSHQSWDSGDTRDVAEQEPGGSCCCVEEELHGGLQEGIGEV